MSRGKSFLRKSFAKIQYVFLAIIVILMALAFQATVRKQLWGQSTVAVMEATKQGATTLSVQINNSFATLKRVSSHLKDARNADELCEKLEAFAISEPSVSVYLKDGTVYPEDATLDFAALAGMEANVDSYGIVNPHISSANGVNVFDIYVWEMLADRTGVYIVKEFPVNEVAGSFTLSFYDGAGYSYVIDKSGNIMIRPGSAKSNVTSRNLFDALGDENDGEIVAALKDSLSNGKTGWAVVGFEGEQTFFGYRPVSASLDWCLVSIVPVKAMLKEASIIIFDTFIMMGVVIFCIFSAMLLSVLRERNDANKIKKQSKYANHILNTVSEGISVLGMKEPHYIMRTNNSGLEMLGLEGVDGSQSLEDVVFNPDKTRVSGLLDRVATTKNSENYEFRVMRPGGRIVWLAGKVEASMDDAGIPALMVTHHDITERKISESDAERRRVRERNLLTTAASGLYQVVCAADFDNDTFSIIYNRNLPLPEWIGDAKTYTAAYEGMLSRLTESSREDFISAFSTENILKRLSGKERTSWCDVELSMSDGKIHWVSVQAISPKEESNHVCVFLFRVIDEEKKREEESRQVLRDSLEAAKAANEAKSQFLSNMSHDIRTPLNAIIGMTAIVSRHVDDKEQVADGLKKISLSGQHLLSLINDILDMSKIESGKMTLQNEIFNYAELVSETVELIKTAADSSGISLSVDLSAVRNESVTGDKLRIRQIFLNILSNAVKYTGKGGTISVTAKDTGVVRSGKNMYVFECRDTGIGMSKEFLEHLFEPFSRAQDSTTSKIPGTGLGMAITENLVTMIGGTIRAESEVGKGSTFTVSLPLHSTKQSEADIPERFKGIRCLVVDDDESACKNTAEMLLDIALRAEYVTTGAEAVRRVLSAKDSPDPFELVIVDWKMPEMDGIEVARRIRAGVGADIPIIILTAYNWIEIEAEARSAGVTAFLEKPFYRSRFCYLLNEISTGGGGKAAEAEDEPDPDFSGKRVLLVEDNEMNREIAETLLGETGVEIDDAVDGQDAVKVFSASEEFHYDMIFMDVQMPIMNGYEATRKIRSLDRADAKKVPIIAMTANVFDEDVEEAYKAGMNGHCGKPIDLKKLYQIMKEHFQWRTY